MKRTLLAAAFVLAAASAQAQGTYTTTPIFGGFSTTTGPAGYSATTRPGGSRGFFTTTDNRGTVYNSVPHPGGGFRTTVAPGSGYGQSER